MPTKLTKALEFANYRVTLNNQQHSLKAKTETLLTYSVNGGTFSIDQSLISFCKLLLDENITETVLLDVYEHPILIADLSEFYNDVFSRYFEVINEYYIEYEKLKSARKVHKVLDINESYNS